MYASARYVPCSYCVVLNVPSGDAPPIEADEFFSVTYRAAVELLSQQNVVYEQEEHALRVLMEEELNEKMAEEKEKRGTVGHSSMYYC